MRSRLTILLLLFAGAIYIGCMLSPPSLMDDVDAVQAQIARNMLTSGDWVTARLDGVAYLEKAPLIYWLIAICYKLFGVHDWVARIPVVLAALLLAWVTAAFGTWAFGPPRRILRGPMHLHLRRTVSLHPHPNPRRDAHRVHRSFHVGLPARHRRRRAAPAPVGATVRREPRHQPAAGRASSASSSPSPHASFIWPRRVSSHKRKPGAAFIPSADSPSRS